MFGESFWDDNRGLQAFGKACMTFVTQANSYFFHFQHGQRNFDFARKRLDFSDNSLWPSNPGERDAHDSFHEQT